MGKFSKLRNRIFKINMMFNMSDKILICETSLQKRPPNDNHYDVNVCHSERRKRNINKCVDEPPVFDTPQLISALFLIENSSIAILKNGEL